MRDHAVALAVLLLVRTPRVRRRRRGSVVLQLHEHRLRRARDHHRRIRRDHVRGAGRREELLLVRQLLRRRLLVEVRAVELEQAVLRLLDQLHRSAVLRLEREELAVLLLTLLRRLGDRLVERLHFRLEGRNLLRKRLARSRHLLDRSLAARDRILRARLLRLALGQVLVTEVLLRVVILLLLAQHDHHAVDLSKNLREVHRLRLQAVLDERKLSLVRPHLLEGLHDAAGLERRRRGRLLLQEAHRHLRERQRLLEQVQRIIIVENLDGLADRGNLLSAHLAALRPLLLLRLAHRRQVRNEGRRVLNVVSGGGDLHSKLATADRLRLNRLARGRDLRLLRISHGSERLHGLLLSPDSTAEVLVHLVLHGLEDASDLARPSAVVAERVLALQEAKDLIALEVVNGLRRLHRLHHAAHAGLLRLEERRAHALLQRGDGARHGIEVGLLAARLLREVSRLLLADRRRSLQVLLRRRAVRLVLDQLLVHLALLRIVSLQLALQLREALPGRLHGLAHAIRVALAVAHELVKRLLLHVTLRLDLLLHILEDRHDLPNRVGLSLQSESCAAPNAEKQGREAGHA